MRIFIDLLIEVLRNEEQLIRRIEKLEKILKGGNK